MEDTTIKTPDLLAPPNPFDSDSSDLSPPPIDCNPSSTVELLEDDMMAFGENCTLECEVRARIHDNP